MHTKMAIVALVEPSVVEAGGPAPSPLEVLLQGHVGADEVGAADGRGVVVDDVTQRKVDVRLDVLLVRRSRHAAAIMVVVAWHADLRPRPPDGVAVAGEQLHHLTFRSGALVHKWSNGQCICSVCSESGEVVTLIMLGRC